MERVPRIRLGDRNTWNLIGAIVLNIILKLVGISRYGSTGAAWATLFCEVGLITTLSLQVQKILK